MQKLLYRGVSVVDDKKNGGKLLPKGDRTQLEGQCGELWVQCGEGVECGSSEGNALVAHQYDSDKSNTAYLSATKNIEIAIWFATNGHLEDGYVYTLSVERFGEFGIMAFERSIGSVANEDEVTIRTKDLGPVPEGVIVSKQLVKSA